MSNVIELSQFSHYRRISLDEAISIMERLSILVLRVTRSEERSTQEIWGEVVTQNILGGAECLALLKDPLHARVIASANTFIGDLANLGDMARMYQRESSPPSFILIDSP